MKSKKDIKSCVICREPIYADFNGWDGGHNPWPVRKKGRCCGECNDAIVVPRRLYEAGILGENIVSSVKEVKIDDIKKITKEIKETPEYKLGKSIIKCIGYRGEE